MGGGTGRWLIGLRRISSNGTRDATSQLCSLVTETRPQLFTPDSQSRHGGSNSSGGSAIVTQPSQLISLVLLTASLELLGFEIRSRQAISIPKRKETISLSGY